MLLVLLLLLPLLVVAVCGVLTMYARYSVHHQALLNVKKSLYVEWMVLWAVHL